MTKTRGKDGCEYSPRCEDCPLTACRYELPPRMARRQLHEKQIKELQALGVGRRDIATRLGITAHTVSRILGRK